MRKHVICAVILISLGVLLILGAPYIPDIFFTVILKYDSPYSELRFWEVVPSFQMAGIVLSAFGIVIYKNRKDT